MDDHDRVDEDVHLWVLAGGGAEVRWHGQRVGLFATMVEAVAEAQSLATAVAVPVALWQDDQRPTFGTIDPNG